MIKAYADDVKKVYPVAKAYFFGLWARNQAIEHSDVDVSFF
jgi:predicted nucleotidyltransferase